MLTKEPVVGMKLKSCQAILEYSSAKMEPEGQAGKEARELLKMNLSFSVEPYIFGM